MDHLPKNRIDELGQRKVFECTNPHCRTIWDADPCGHCPACKLPGGGGWSTAAKLVRHLTLPEHFISKSLSKPFVHPVDDDA